MTSTQRHIFYVLASIVIFYFTMWLSWTYYELPFSLADTNISRLGRPLMNPNGHHWWLLGMLGSNIFLLLYYNGLKRWKIGDPTLDRWITILTGLAYLSCAALIGLGIINADYYLPHRIIGAVYFSSDIIIMGIGIFLILKHPKIDNWMAVICFLSAACDAIFLASSGKMSWAEWATVALSYSVALLLALNARRLVSDPA